MITLPLSLNELPVVHKLNPTETDLSSWSASSDALPVDNVVVFCYFNSIQWLQRTATIIEAYICDGQWISADDAYYGTWFPLEDCMFWIGIEQVPKLDDSSWSSSELTPPLNVMGDVWIVQDVANDSKVISLWLETGSIPTRIDHCLYYGSSGDPVLHSRRIDKWMLRSQPDDIDIHFENVHRDVIRATYRPRPVIELDCDLEELIQTSWYTNSQQMTFGF